MKKSLLIFALGLFLLPVTVAKAAPPEGATKLFEETGQQVYNIKAEADKPSLESYTALIINGLLTIVGTIFLLMTIYGGLLWMLARGKEEQAKKARDIVVMAIIGLTVTFASYALAYFVFTQLVSKV